MGNLADLVAKVAQCWARRQARASKSRPTSVQVSLRWQSAPLPTLYRNRDWETCGSKRGSPLYLFHIQYSVSSRFALSVTSYESAQYSRPRTYTDVAQVLDDVGVTDAISQLSPTASVFSSPNQRGEATAQATSDVAENAAAENAAATKAAEKAVANAAAPMAATMPEEVLAARADAEAEVLQRDLVAQQEIEALRAQAANASQQAASAKEVEILKAQLAAQEQETQRLATEREMAQLRVQLQAEQEAQASAQAAANAAEHSREAADSTPIYCRKCKVVGTRLSCDCAPFLKTTEIPMAGVIASQAAAAVAATTGVTPVVTLENQKPEWLVDAEQRQRQQEAEAQAHAATAASAAALAEARKNEEVERAAAEAARASEEAALAERVKAEQQLAAQRAEVERLEREAAIERRVAEETNRRVEVELARRVEVETARRLTEEYDKREALDIAALSPYERQQRALRRAYSAEARVAVGRAQLSYAEEEAWRREQERAGRTVYR